MGRVLLRRRVVGAPHREVAGLVVPHGVVVVSGRRRWGRGGGSGEVGEEGIRGGEGAVGDGGADGVAGSARQERGAGSVPRGAVVHRA